MRSLFRVIIIVAGLCCISVTVFSQETVLVSDSLSQRPLGKDLTQLLLWRGLTTPESGFINAVRTDTIGLSFTGIRLTDSASRYSSFTNSRGLKTNTAIDYRFSHRVDRLTDTLAVEFDLLHDAVANSGEAGRMVISLLHDYPVNGPLWQDVDSVNKYHPFGRPMYNVRIMSKNQTPNNNLAGVMLYGGGHVRKGEVEIFRRNNDVWWLTGFSTEAGGFSPGSNGEYPRSGSATARNVGMTSALRWAHFTWRIYPERLELWRRWSNQTTQEDQLAIRMFIPQVDTLNTAPTLARFNQFYNTNLTDLPRLYWWFRHPEAFRLFWAGGVNATVANLKITASGPGVVSSASNTSTPFNNVKVWPNPASDVAYIDIPASLGEVNINITELSGKVVYNQSNATGLSMVDCQFLPSGVYHVKLTGSKCNIVKRLVIR